MLRSCVAQPAAEDSVHLESLVRMLGHLRDPLLLASANGRILAANVAGAEALGTSVEALRDGSLEAYSPDPAALADELRRSHASSQFPLRARDGRRFNCEASALAPDLLLLRLSGGPEPGPRARAFFEAIARFQAISSGDGRAGDEVCRALLLEGVAGVGALAAGLFLVDEAGANLEM